MNNDFELEVRREYSAILCQLEALSLWLKGTLEEICYHDDLISDFQVRAKNIESLLDKIRSKRNQGVVINNFEDVLEKIDDLVGSRVIVYVPSGIKQVHDLIMRWDRVNIKNIRLHSYNDDTERSNTIKKIVRDLRDRSKQYKLESNETGYFGVHYTLEPKPVDHFYENSRIRLFNKFELQLRTLTQHAWSEVQHKAIYKNKSHIIDERASMIRFADLAEYIILCDKKLENLYGSAVASPTVEIPMNEKNQLSEKFKGLQNKISSLILRYESNEISTSDFQDESSKILTDYHEDIEALLASLKAKKLSHSDIYAVLELSELYLKSANYSNSYELYKQLNELSTIPGDAKVKLFLRLSETCHNMGNIEEAKENIDELERSFQSENYQRTTESHILYTAAARLSWRLKLYDLAIKFGESSLQNTASVLPKLKYLLNLVYYYLDKWEKSDNEDQSLLGQVIDITTLKINEVNEILIREDMPMNANMYDSLAWYYYHLAFYNFVNGQREESIDAIHNAQKHNDGCILRWAGYEQDNEKIIRPTWTEHTQKIRALSKEIQSN
jgi:putative GTP pyrophosphokinase